MLTSKIQWESEMKEQIQIQNILQNLKKNNIEQVLQIINESSFAFCGFNTIKLAFYIVSAVGITPQKIDLYISLISLLTNRAAFNLLPKYIFLILKSRICDVNVYYDNSAEILFFARMVRAHIFSTSLVNTFLNELMHITPQYVELIFWIFCLIFPIIQEDSPSVYVELKNYCQKIFESVKDQISNPIQQTFLNIQTITKEKWVKLISNEYSPDKPDIGNILRLDYVDALKQYIGNPKNKFDVNDRISSTIFEPCPFLYSDPTLVQYCAYFGSIKCFLFLVSQGANLDLQSRKQVIQDFAAVGGNPQIVDFLVKKNYSFEYNLDDIIEYHHSFLFDFLVSTKYSQKELQEAAIHFKAAQYGNTYVLNYCKKNGFDMNEQNDETDLTVLQTASYSGQLGILMLMSSIYPEEIYKLDHDGINHIHYAAELGYWEIVVYLLKENVDSNILTSNGETALNIAIRFRQIDVIKVILSSRSLKTFLDVGIDLTPLCRDVLSYNIESVKLMLRQMKEELKSIEHQKTNLFLTNQLNALNEQSDKINQSIKDAILVAFKCNATDISKLLLSSNTNININKCVTKDGTSPLHFAASNGNIDLVNYLIERKCNINCVDKFDLILIKH